MVVRKRRSDLSDHPVKMTRFDVDEWPGDPAEALIVWRASFFDYWHGRHAPGGLFWLLATVKAARLLVVRGEVADVDELARAAAERSRR